MAFKNIPPSLVALLLQGAAFLLVSALVPLTGLAISLPILVLLCGLLAAFFSHLAGLARWWLVIQLGFVPGLLGMLMLNIPPAYYLCAFLCLVLVYWSTFRTQVPLYLSSKQVWHALQGLMPPAEFSFIDLGSGLGGVLTHLASARPDGHYSGIESAPLPLWLSWLRIKFGGYRNCKVYWGSIWDQSLCNLANYDVVYAYLSPVPMARLWHKARAEMRPGTLFISSTFEVPEQQPQLKIEVTDLHHSTLLVWRM